jgi:transcription elongation factor
MYQRQVSVAYTYNGVAYTFIEGSLATGANSTSGWLMRKFTTAYQDGASAKAYVNPANPSEATLNPRGGVILIWFLGLLALAFWGLAYFVATRG